MEAHVDGNTIAALIAASTAAAVSLLTVYMQFCTWKDNRVIKQSQVRIEGEGKKREEKLDSLHSAVNGRLSELKIRIAKESFEMGRKFQRANGDVESPEMPKPRVDELMRQMEDAHEELARTGDDGGSVHT